VLTEKGCFSTVNRNGGQSSSLQQFTFSWAETGRPAAGSTTYAYLEAKGYTDLGKRHPSFRVAGSDPNDRAS
jgi:hypothetical protein